MRHAEAIYYAASAISDLIRNLKLIKIKNLPSPKRRAMMKKFSLEKEIEKISEDQKPLI